MSSSVLMIGAGGHARVLLDVLWKFDINIIGCVAKDIPSISSFIEPYLGSDEEVLKYSPTDILLVNGIGSVSVPLVRREIFRKFHLKGYRFLTVIHSSVVLSDDLRIGEGAQIMAGAVVQSGATIGRNVLINTGAIIDHDCEVADHVHIAPGVTICGNVQIDEGAHIGTGASIIQGTRIGAGAIVCAGATVIGDVEADSTVAGVPARPLNRR